jgi:Ricin-type beta-trefoil lectin domain-like
VHKILGRKNMGVPGSHRARVLSVIAAAAVMAGLGLATPMRAEAAAAPTVTPNVTCTNVGAIYNKHSAKVAEVFRSGKANGAKVDQWAYNGTPTQHWTLCLVEHYQGIPVYEIINNNSRKCLDLTSDRTRSGTLVQQWTCNGREQQHWLWQNHGTYDVISPFTNANSNSGFSYTLEVRGGSTANGATIDIAISHAATYQEWCPGRACR